MPARSKLFFIYFFHGYFKDDGDKGENLNEKQPT